MCLIRGQPSMYMPVFLTILTAGLQVCSVDSEVVISEACHGPPVFTQTHNKLECDEGTQICILEVKFYQWDPNDHHCPRLLSAPVPDRCCRGNTSRCSWVRNKNDDRHELQENCTGQRQCDLHSSSSKLVPDPCVRPGDISTFSSVRSITYTCTSSGEICTRHMEDLSVYCSPRTCPPLATTTISAGSTGGSEESSSIKTNATTYQPTVASYKTTATYQPTVTSYETTSPNNSLALENTTRDIFPLKWELNDTGAIVGGVMGGLVVCVLIVVLLVFLWKRRSAEKPRILQTENRDDDVTEAHIVSRPNAGYDNINSRYSLYQLERDDRGTPWNRAAQTNVSDLYSKVNKTGRAANTSGDAAFSVGSAARTNHHGDYDRVQGEAAHFKVHGDYDHVVTHSYGESSSDDVMGGVRGNADVDMTYNQLHRGRAVPTRTETEANPYDVLNRANTRAKQDLDA